MKTSLVFLCIIFLVATTSWPVFGQSYFGFDDFGGSWLDAEKSPTNYDDDLLCWAASASNLLSWTGWGSAYSSDADIIFRYFQDHWSDEGDCKNMHGNGGLTEQIICKGLADGLRKRLMVVGFT